jgi:hypothetical protein
MTTVRMVHVVTDAGVRIDLLPCGTTCGFPAVVIFETAVRTSTPACHYHEALAAGN